MAIDRRVGVKVVIEGEGDDDLIKRQADALEEMESASAGAATAVERVGNQLERGFGASQRTVDAARAALNRYEQALRDLEEAGGEVGEEQIANLKRLEGEYEKAIGSVGEFRVAQQQAKRAIDDATEAAGGQVDRVNSLDDIVRKITEDLGAGAVKWLSWGTAATGAFTAAFKAGSELREVLNNTADALFGTNKGFDAFVDATMHTQEAADMLAEKFIGLGDSSKLVENQMNILRKNGIDPTGMSAEQLTVAVDQLGIKMQQASIAAGAAADASREAAEAQSAHTAATAKAVPLQQQYADALQVYRDALAPIPNHIAEQAEALGLVVPLWERQNVSMTPFSQHARDIGEAVAGMAEKFKGVSGALDSFGAAIAKGMSDARREVASLSGDIDALINKANAANATLDAVAKGGDNAKPGDKPAPYAGAQGGGDLTPFA